MPRKLKVFCTPIGFHDAYVAAPSQKAALEAWGTDANLFARGMATVATDPTLTKEPLANPGKVIKRARGTAEQHLASLPKTAKVPPSRDTEETKPAKSLPKPSRRKLEAAEQAIDRAEEKYRRAADAIREREEALRQERHALNAKRDTELATLQRRSEDARADYDRAIAEWRD